MSAFGSLHITGIITTCVVSGIPASWGSTRTQRIRSFNKKCTFEFEHHVAITAAVGVDWRTLRPFAKSFRHFAPCARLVVMVSDVAPTEVITELKAIGAEILPLTQAWPFVRLSDLDAQTGNALAEFIPRGLTLATGPGVARTPGAGGLVTLRYFVADVWLAASARFDEEMALESGGQNQRGAADIAITGQYPRRRLVLLTDSVDVIFQESPFEHAIGKWSSASLRSGHEKVWVFEEHSKRKIGGCAFNTEGLRPLGPLALQSLADRTVVSSGIVLGTADGVRGLIAAMRTVVELLRGRELNDQGILNALARRAPVQVPSTSEFNQTPVSNEGGYHSEVLRTFPVPGLQIVPHGCGPVRNLGIELVHVMGHANYTNVRIRPHPRGWLQVLGEGNRPAPILHQHDRLSNLKDFLEERWVADEEVRGRLAGFLLKVRPKNVAELEAFMFQGSPCFSRDGCCFQKWHERQAQFLERSGQYLSNALYVLGMDFPCHDLGRTVHLGFSFDVAGILTRLAKTSLPEERIHLLATRRQLSAQRHLCPKVLNGMIGCPLIHHWGVRKDMPCSMLQIRSSRFCALSWQACLDEKCSLSETSASELSQVLWKMVLAWLSEQYEDAGWEVPSAMKQAVPQSHEFWVREIGWAGKPEEVAANWSSALDRLRLTTESKAKLLRSP